ncbi:DUF6266 family protein [Pedobacter hiemivivus]|uniref:Uncharacterized protein n=1 Tax=Pedobacter hiemivivus TaxID=2530454 RepID=A0A4R0NBJ1_9SPHI|nr:DUF6266 family protein [Pedobacter hiemivivus]TCC96987.1 hypothetical protein EZ444_09005 [Pedobacter hiemivivus]
MAIIKKGILGGFKGKSGTVIGYHLKGQDLMRGIPRERSTPPTKKELVNRAKFATSQIWLQPLIEFLRVGFQGYAETYEGFVAAKSYNSKHALKGENPDFYIDPKLALLSFGDMDQSEKASAVSESPGTVTFEWDGGRLVYDDRAMFVAYDIEKGKACFDTAAVKRSKKTGTFEIGPDYSGKTVHVYLAFVSEDRKRRSNSQYLGAVKVL